MINLLNLTGKHIVITGASQGIGKEATLLVSKLGAKATLISRNQQKLNEVLTQMEGNHHSLSPFDLREIDQIDNLVKQIVDSNGPIDGFVHSAGIAIMRPLSLTKYDFLHDMMLLNFYSFVELIRCMSKKGNYREGASFVGVSSIASFVGVKSKTAYCASKSAMDSSIRTIAKELSKKRIRVNSIIGGFVKTEMYDAFIENVGEKGVIDHITERQYLGIGNSSDFCNAIAFLLSDASKFITGTGLVVDGGYLS